MDTELQTLGYSASFIVLALAIVFAGKLARDAIRRLWGHRTPPTAAKGNLAAAVELCGFLLALVLGLIGSLVLTGQTWLTHAADLLLTGVLVTAALLLNDWLTGKAIFRGIDNFREIHEQRNMALAVGRAGSALATGLVIRGALGHDSALLDRVLWVFAGQAALVAIALLYQLLTAYDDLAEIRSQNIAAGLPLAGILIAVGITVEAALHGEGDGWIADLLSVGMDLSVSLLLLYLLRLATDRFLLGGARLHDEIAGNRNAGVGLIEATSFVSGALLLAFFLS